MPVVFAIMGALTYWGTLLVCKIASSFRPSIDSFSSYPDSAQTVIACSLLIGSIPFGFIGANLLLWSIPPLRRFFNLEASERGGETFRIVTRQLLHLSAWTAIPAFAISLGTALFFD